MEAVVVAVTSHPVDGVDAQDFEAFGHDGCCGLAEQHPPHVHLYHLTWTHTEGTVKNLGF